MAVGQNFGVLCGFGGAAALATSGMWGPVGLFGLGLTQYSQVPSLKRQSNSIFNTEHNIQPRPQGFALKAGIRGIDAPPKLELNQKVFKAASLKLFATRGPKEL